METEEIEIKINEAIDFKVAKEIANAFVNNYYNHQPALVGWWDELDGEHSGETQSADIEVRVNDYLFYYKF